MAWFKEGCKQVLSTPAHEQGKEFKPCIFKGTTIPPSLQRMIVLAGILVVVLLIYLTHCIDNTKFISRLPHGALDDLMSFDPIPPTTSKKSVYDSVRPDRFNPDRASSNRQETEGILSFLGRMLGISRNQDEDALEEDDG